MQQAQAVWRNGGGSDSPSGAFRETVSDSPSCVQLYPPLRQAAASLGASGGSAVGKKVAEYLTKQNKLFSINILSAKGGGR